MVKQSQQGVALKEAGAAEECSVATKRWSLSPAPGGRKPSTPGGN